jgi:cytochrome c peroxidase
VSGLVRAQIALAALTVAASAGGAEAPDGTAQNPAARPARAGAAPGCLLFTSEAARADAERCMACHRLSRTHPVDLDYAAAQGRQPSSLRAPGAVVRRGVFLPDGQIRCVTCHDARSPWKDRIALPPGAPASPTVDPGVPATYETHGTHRAAPLPGTAVTARPLCLACHALD